ncbi:MAG: NYN domain-containing protein [Chloroflexi bacterium]|nr:NYN domain-containing protein [Chloroflexota bacterium]
MSKIMIFIDGTWLYSNSARLCDSYGDPDFRIDFGKLPHVLASEVSRHLGPNEVDVIRTYLFGSYAANYDLRDEDSVNRRRDFFDMLREEYHYEVETYPINYMGRRVRKMDRDPRDPFEPKEKCVDISLATAVLYYAAIPNAYDIAVVVVGDRDFIPMLQNVRRLGKRVAIASIKNSCAPEFADPSDESRVKDYDLIWLDDLLHRLELKYERHQEKCDSPFHHGNPYVWTTFKPRKGQKFYCDDCKQIFMKQKRDAQQEMGDNPEEELNSEEQLLSEDQESNGNVLIEMKMTGYVKKLFPAKGYGFIAADNGNDYFFHLTDLVNLEFERLFEGMEVDFEIKNQPSNGKQGSAQNVHPHFESTE